MADVDFPFDICHISATDYGTARSSTVRRTEMEDGFIQQKKTQSTARRIHEFEVTVKNSDKETFETWLDTNGDGEFNFISFTETMDLDPFPEDFASISDDLKYDARIVGGAAGIQLRLQAGRRVDGYIWTGSMTVEYMK